MKKFLYSTLAVLLLAIVAMAQAPQTIPYQAVARNSGNLVVSQPVGLRFTIRNLTAGGAIVYQETQSATTNTLGLFNVSIGSGTPVSGTMSAIGWGSGAKFLQVEIDPAGGVAYTDMGTTQLQSVPYAQYANLSGGSTFSTGFVTYRAGTSTFVVPSGIFQIKVFVSGGGGGGNTGGWGAGSGYAGKVMGVLDVTPGESLTILGGAGGTGGSSSGGFGQGGKGSTITRVTGGILLCAAGGGGGTGTNAGTGAAGPGKPGGTVFAASGFDGANGTAGNSSSNLTNGGAGGNSYVGKLREWNALCSTGVAAYTAFGQAAGTAPAGSSGTAPAAGTFTAGDAVISGAGGAGEVVIYW